METLEYLCATEVRAEHILAAAHRLGLTTNVDSNLGTIGVQCFRQCRSRRWRWSCWMQIPIAEVEDWYGAGDALFIQRIAELRPVSIWSVDVPGDCFQRVALVLWELLHVHGGVVNYRDGEFGIDNIHILGFVWDTPRRSRFNGTNIGEQAVHRIAVNDRGMRRERGWFMKGFDLTWDAITGWSLISVRHRRPAGRRALELQHKDGITLVKSAEVGDEFDGLVLLVQSRLPHKRAKMIACGAERHATGQVDVD